MIMYTCRGDYVDVVCECVCVAQSKGYSFAAFASICSVAAIAAIGGLRRFFVAL